jgi:hypothetical protein
VVSSFHHGCDFRLSLAFRQLFREAEVHSVFQYIGEESEVGMPSQYPSEVAYRAELRSEIQGRVLMLRQELFYVEVALLQELGVELH